MTALVNPILGSTASFLPSGADWPGILQTRCTIFGALWHWPRKLMVHTPSRCLWIASSHHAAATIEYETRYVFIVCYYILYALQQLCNSIRNERCMLCRIPTSNFSHTRTLRILILPRSVWGHIDPYDIMNGCPVMKTAETLLSSKNAQCGREASRMLKNMCTKRQYILKT